MAKKVSQWKRYKKLMPDGVPRHIRCYDNGGETYDRYTVDRYTVVYVYLGRMGTNGHQDVNDGYPHVTMSGSPFWPLGVCQHGESQDGPIDRPKHSHLGEKIQFEDLPEDCQKVVVDDYLGLWDIREIHKTALVRHYLENKGLSCMYCDEGNVEGGDLEFEMGRIEHEMRCTDCGRRWIDVYKLSDVAFFTEGE